MQQTLKPKRNAYRQHGFTLIELMVTVAIVGILAAIAYPSYMESVRRGKRADAQTVLLEAQQFMQRYYSANNTYEGASLPAALQYAPKGAASAAAAYSLAASTASGGYTVTATPSVTDAKCGDLTISDTGVKSHSGTASNLKDCWN